MFCSNCGKEIADNTRFCPECGAPIKGNNEDAYKENSIQPESQGISVEKNFASLRQMTEQAIKSEI